MFSKGLLFRVDKKLWLCGKELKTMHSNRCLEEQANVENTEGVELLKTEHAEDLENLRQTLLEEKDVEESKLR